MTNQIHVDADNMRRHAENIEREIIPELNKALEAGQQANIPEDAFGIFCYPFHDLITKAIFWAADQESAIKALEAAPKSMKQTADDVRKAAGLYEDTDGSNRDLFPGV